MRPGLHRTGDPDVPATASATAPARGRRAGRAPRASAAATLLAGALLAGAGTGWAVSATGPQSPPTPSAAPAADALAVRDRAPVVARGADTGARPYASPTPTAAPTAAATPSATPSPTPSPTPTLPPALTAADVAAGLLADGVPESASGELAVVAARSVATASAASTARPTADRVVRIRVEVEKGLAVDPDRFASFVMDTLTDPRGWGADGSVAFVATDGTPDIRVVLASPDLVDEMCAPLQTEGQVSCGTNGHAVLNYRRWVEAVPDYGDDRTGYRQYLVNHEVGHLLLHRHRQCGGAGQRAHIMVQQSYGVKPCVPNPWPFPED